MSEHSAICIYGILSKVGVPVNSSFCTCGAIDEQLSDATGVIVMEIVAAAVANAFDTGLFNRENYSYLSDSDWDQVVRGVKDGASEERPSAEELANAVEYFKLRASRVADGWD